MGQPIPPSWERRAECPACGLKVAYMPFGQACLVHGYVWQMRLRAWWRGEPIPRDPRDQETLMRLALNREGR